MNLIESRRRAFGNSKLDMPSHIAREQSTLCKSHMNTEVKRHKLAPEIRSHTIRRDRKQNGLQPNAHMYLQLNALKEK